MKSLLLILWTSSPGIAQAQEMELGRSGWQLERPSNDFVLLRSNISPTERNAGQGRDAPRQGLFILTCERNVRRIRFQLSGTPRNPSIHASSQGRAIVRGWAADERNPAATIYPDVRFFDDGSFEVQETKAFGDSAMRGFLGILQTSPVRLEVVLFKGPNIRSFVAGRAVQFRLANLDESLANIYGFEGLCFRSDR